MRFLKLSHPLESLGKLVKSYQFLSTTPLFSLRVRPGICIYRNLMQASHTWRNTLLLSFDFIPLSPFHHPVLAAFHHLTPVLQQQLACLQLAFLCYSLSSCQEPCSENIFGIASLSCSEVYHGSLRLIKSYLNSFGGDPTRLTSHSPSFFLVHCHPSRLIGHFKSCQTPC